MGTHTYIHTYIHQSRADGLTQQLETERADKRYIGMHITARLREEKAACENMRSERDAAEARAESLQGMLEKVCSCMYVCMYVYVYVRARAESLQGMLEKVCSCMYVCMYVYVYVCERAESFAGYA